MKKLILILPLFIFLSGRVPAQLPQQPTDDKAQLEKERLEIQKEIKEIQDQYDKIKGQKKQTLGQYNLLERKIKLQNKYVDNINRELRYIDDGIYLSNVEIYRLSRQLDTLKAQYARSVVYAYKNRSTYDFLNFIFSASNFNDAVKRIAYLKSYRSYREQQVNNIKETQALLSRKKEEQLGKKKEKDVALKNQTEQVKVLEGQKKEKDVVLSGLKSKEKDLEKQLVAKKKRDRDLKNAIDAIAKRIIENKRKEAEIENLKSKTATTTSNSITSATPGSTSIKTTPTRTDSYLELNASEKALGANFESSKSRLPWPVDQGYVCIHYGLYQIGDTKLKGDNPGITICTPQPGVTAKSVFEGEVESVFNVGDTKAVMIRHGKYFTIYSNLSSASVSKGASVRTGQPIGTVAVDDEEGVGGKLEFVLMVETKNINPEPWLRR